VQLHQPMHVKVGDRPRDQRQQSDTGDRGPPNPPVRGFRFRQI
jgi:hypothetical protein